MSESFDDLEYSVNPAGEPTMTRFATINLPGQKKAPSVELPVGPLERQAIERATRENANPRIPGHMGRSGAPIVFSPDEVIAIKAERKAADHAMYLKLEDPASKRLRIQEEEFRRQGDEHRAKVEAQEAAEQAARDAAEEQELGEAIKWAEEKEQTEAARSLLSAYRAARNRPKGKL